MRVLVTGAAGFIGNHLGRRLHTAGHEVLTDDKRWGTSTTSPVWLNLRRLDGVDVIVHCGANCSTADSIRNPAADFVDNAVGTFNVVEGSRRAGGIPIIFMSTIKVEPGHDGLVAPLGLSKRIGEDYLRLYGTLYDVPSVINRPSTVYGPGQDGTPDSGWFTWFIKASLTNQTIDLAGDGTQSRDVLYIDDMVNLLVDQVEHFWEYAAAGAARSVRPWYAVGGGAGNTVNLNELLETLDHTNIRHVPRLPGDLDQVVSDIRHVRSVRGWQPTVGWRDGLNRTLTHLKEHL